MFGEKYSHKLITNRSSGNTCPAFQNDQHEMEQLSAGEDEDDSSGERAGTRTRSTLHEELSSQTMPARETVSYQSSLTGVTVYTRAHIRLLFRKRRKINCVKCIEETAENLQTSTPSTTEDQQSDPEESQVSGDDMPQCVSCGKLYRNRTALQRHLATCQGRILSKSVLNRALRMVVKLLNSTDTNVYISEDVHPALETMQIDETIGKVCFLAGGWGNRPVQGETLGAYTVAIYQDKLMDWFEDGNKEGGRKMSSSRMIERFKQLYPGRYDIPGEQNVIRYIISLVRRSKIVTVGLVGAVRLLKGLLLFGIKDQECLRCM